MSRKEPKNETYLAAELALVMPPARAAMTAVELCKIGRAYKRMAEKLCGGSEEWGDWNDDVGKAQERAFDNNRRRVQKAAAQVVGLPVKIYVSESSGLLLMCETKGIHKTALL
jgi:hypothetical protein